MSLSLQGHGQHSQGHAVKEPQLVCSASSRRCNSCLTMSRDSRSCVLDSDKNLSYPCTCIEPGEGYECLSVIQVTPRTSCDAKSIATPCLGSEGGNKDTYNKKKGESFNASFSVSTATSSINSRRERQSTPNFWSYSTGEWKRSGSDPESIFPDISTSTSIILEKKFSSRGLPESLNAIEDEEREVLNRRLFCSRDGADAREFQEFLIDHEGERLRTPVLCLVGYGGQGAHASDLWVLMHNTFRRELFDVFEMLNIVRSSYLSLILSDIYNLRKWWRFFVTLWSEYENYENTLLDPIVHKICLLDGRGDVLLKRLGPLRETREWLRLKMEEVTSYIEEFENLPPGRALSLFCKNVDSFGDRAMGYFAGVERLLPRFVESYYGEEVKLSVEGQLIKRMRNGKYFAEFVIALVRWMGTEESFSTTNAQERKRERWMNTHLFWLERLSLSKFYRKYEASHGCVLTYFQGRFKEA
ncbi:unnamed protein product [Chondrus crispus]|uniref:Uncharacterized protein n=1 Tax=Chondrus crispus TaxID=2769 RepID=R7QPL2_CHOCR|nr:unnamed protein product [Chondrus crispus]CDF39335.1 unnamed protein product [Chondrus crispus]|eukprot:XP_005719246.1 unnamed protein product [Chondrus crispus]